jgi:hypothetical protein
MGCLFYPRKQTLAELHGALIFINAEAALLGRPKAACSPTYIDRLHWVPNNRLLDMLALRTFERQKVGMGGTRFDPGQHHPALTLRAVGPIEGKQRRGGMTIGFRHDASPVLGGGGTLSGGSDQSSHRKAPRYFGRRVHKKAPEKRGAYSARCRYEGR